VKRLLALVALALSLSACDLGVHTETRPLGEAALSLTLEPWPLTVGVPVTVYVTLRARKAPVSGCALRWRQYPEGMAVEGDGGFVDLPEVRPAGVYSLRLDPFDEAGPWVMELDVACAPLIPAQRLVFRYPVRAK